MSATRAAQDQIVLALLTAHQADDHDLRRDLLVDAWGPAASDEAVGEGIDALVRLIASLRAVLARSGTDNAMALTVAGRHRRGHPGPLRRLRPRRR